MAFGNQEFDPIHAAANELDTMLAVHGGFVGAHNFADPLRLYREVRTLKHVIPLMTHATSMISQGVFDRYPKLRVAYLEAGCGWVPYIMDLMDEQFERKGAADLKRKPSEYLMADNIYFSFEIDERTLPFFIQTMGDKNSFGLQTIPTRKRARSSSLIYRPSLRGRMSLRTPNVGSCQRIPSDCTRYEEGVGCYPSPKRGID